MKILRIENKDHQNSRFKFHFEDFSIPELISCHLKALSANEVADNSFIHMCHSNFIRSYASQISSLLTLRDGANSKLIKEEHE